MVEQVQRGWSRQAISAHCGRAPDRSPHQRRTRLVHRSAVQLHCTVALVAVGFGRKARQALRASFIPRLHQYRLPPHDGLGRRYGTQAAL